MGWRQKRTKEANEYFRRQILNHADTLAEEMNLRLFLCEESVLPQRVLFVESATVTDIVFPHGKTGIFGRMGRAIRRLFGRLCALLPKKNK